MKKLCSILMIVCLLCAMAVTASAEDYSGGADWGIQFTQDGKMSKSVTNAQMADAIANLEPGDSIAIRIRLSNANSQATDWYMTNTILSAMEDNGASGGAYGYDLTYTSASGEERTLYSSDTVGGESASESGAGLREIDALSDYVYLDSLNAGQAGYIDLEVTLDGETQGNDYMNQLADLQMNFAVELNASSGNGNGSASAPGRIVKTGDEMDLFPYYVAMVTSGILILFLAIDMVLKRRRKEGAK